MDCSHKRAAQHGMTLVELVMYISIAGALLGYATPTARDMIERSRATSAINWVIGSVVFARYAAISNNAPVTLCPSRSGDQCGGAWHEGTLAFIDLDMDRQIDPSDVVLKRFEFPVAGATLRFRSFGNRQYLQMRAEGYTNWQNGNFTYCPESRDPRFARQLIINMPGRARVAADIDGDGIVEDTRGRDVSC